MCRHCILVLSLVVTILSLFTSPPPVGQVTIKEKLSLTPHALRRVTSDPTDLTIVFSWTNDSSYGLGAPQTPFHLGVGEPNEQITVSMNSQIPSAETMPIR